MSSIASVPVYEPSSIELSFSNLGIFWCVLINLIVYDILSYFVLIAFVGTKKGTKGASEELTDTGTHSSALFGSIIPLLAHIVLSYVVSNGLNKLLLFPVLGLIVSIRVLMGSTKLKEGFLAPPTEAKKK